MTSASKPPPPAAPAAPARVEAPLSAALFNVGGQTFQVAAKLIRSKAETLPAKLLAKASDPTRPLHIPVDICPERFRILLDWYRYGEIWVPNTVATKAVLRDAARPCHSFDNRNMVSCRLLSVGTMVHGSCCD